MDELFRSWMQPVPESRDPRPVFPVEVTQPIDAALSKMRGIDQRSREAANANQAQRMHAVPPRVGSAAQPGRTTTPNGQYAYQPPPQIPAQSFPGMQSLPYQSHPPPFPTSMRSPAPASLPSPIRQSAVISNSPYNAPPPPGGAAANYVYTGPPPPTMSHQARLDKLRYDVGGLLDSVRVHLAHYPHDQEKLKLVGNLQSLKTLLDTGSLSLTHIQSTEIVVANIARDLPFRPPATSVQAPTPQPPTQAAPPPFDPSVIASILARGTPQPTPQQSAPAPVYAPPPPVVSTPQFASAFPAIAAPQQAAAAPPPSMSQIMSLLKPNTPSSAAATPVPAPAGSGLSLLDQLRASGILGVTPVQSTPVQAPAAANILSQLMQPQPGAQALNDVKMEAVSLKMYVKKIRFKEHRTNLVQSASTFDTSTIR